jgi:hypothetical protein
LNVSFMVATGQLACCGDVGRIGLRVWWRFVPGMSRDVQRWRKFWFKDVVRCFEVEQQHKL